jgi:sorbitol-6-phosphate 2-dehydrogenase
MNNSWLGLEGKVAIVTGGASGIGLNISNELLNNGVKLVVGEKGEKCPSSRS